MQKLDRVLTRRPGARQDRRAEDRASPGHDRTASSASRSLLDGHAGYAPIDLDEFAEVFAGALAIMGPGHVSVCTQDGEDVGFAFVYPDYAEDVRALDGHAAGWGRWLGTSRATRLVASTSALIPEARRSSTAMAQVAWGLQHAIAGGFNHVVVALVVEGWLSKIGEQTREYALYGRALT